MSTYYRSPVEERATAAEQRTKAKTERELALAADARRQREHDAEMAERAAERARANEAARQAGKAAKRAEKAAKRAEKRKAWAGRLQKVLGGVREHMPVLGIPVVVVSAIMAWGGQFDAAVKLGFGGYAPGVPLMLEGLTLTLAAMTATAIMRRTPHRRLMSYTWASALGAAGLNAYGHSLTGGLQMAIVFAIASLVGVFLWWLGVTAGRAERTVAQIRDARARARHARARRRHFRTVHKRAKRLRIAAPYGTVDTEDAWARAWTDIYGQPVGQDQAPAADTPDATEDVLADLFADTFPADWIDANADAADTVREHLFGQVDSHADTPGTTLVADTEESSTDGAERTLARTPRKPRVKPPARQAVDPAVIAEAAAKLDAAGVKPSARKLAKLVPYGHNACAKWLKTQRS